MPKATLPIAVLDIGFTVTFMPGKKGRKVGREHLAARDLDEGSVEGGQGLTTIQTRGYSPSHPFLSDEPLHCHKAVSHCLWPPRIGDGLS